MKLGFNTTGNSQTSGRTTQAMNLGKLRNTVGSLTRKYKYCNNVDRNYVFQCVFNQSIAPPPADGSIQTIVSLDGTILTSTDFGVNWFVDTTYQYTTTLVDVAMGNNGQYRTVINGYSGSPNSFFTYNPNTKTWSQPTFTPTTNTNLTNISMSNNGQYQYVFQIFSLFSISSDSGINWSDYYSPDNTPDNTPDCSISLDNTGKNQVIAAADSYGQSAVLYSNDYGSTWSGNANITDENSACINVGISPDGSRITTGTISDNIVPSIYTSIDNGISWTQSVVNNPDGYTPYIFGVKITMSYNGKYQLTGTSGEFFGNNQGLLYISSDYGATWNSILNIPNSLFYLYWTSISVSNSGQVMSAVGNDGSNYYCFQSKDYGNTWNIVNTPPGIPISAVAIN
jgi:photosystem II stability/assembly factor-like uncharacterized protein